MKSNSVVSFEKELPNRDLLYISYEKNIPTAHRGVSISVRMDDKGHIVLNSNIRQIPDPSTIYVHLPVSEDYDVPGLPYWPHYIELTSGQRFKYLTWLRAVEQPIDMGYVFLYFYGLERQLLMGNFDKAFDEIIRLRNIHDNKSFQKYSENALIHAAILRDRSERLIDLHEKTLISGYSNAMFLLAYNAGIDLGVDQLILVFHKAFPASRKAVSENRQLFCECLTTQLIERYGNAAFVLKEYDLSKVKTVTETRFANYSFPHEIQHVEITDFYQCKSLMQDLENLYAGAYQLYKSKKNLVKSNKTPEEIAVALEKKNETRYKKLLKEQLITPLEFELLAKNNQRTWMV